MIKTTEKYVLFRVGDTCSAIVNAKFKRKKETEDFIYLSVPESYRFGVSERLFNEETRKWETTKQKDLPAKNMRVYLNKYDEDEVLDNEWEDLFPSRKPNKQVENELDLPDDDLPF